MPDKNQQVIILSLQKARKKRKQDMVNENPDEEEKQERTLTFKQEEIGDKFVELENGKVLKLNIFGRVINRDNKSGTMTIDALTIAKDENNKANEGQKIIPSPSA